MKTQRNWLFRVQLCGVLFKHNSGVWYIICTYAFYIQLCMYVKDLCVSLIIWWKKIHRGASNERQRGWEHCSRKADGQDSYNRRFIIWATVAVFRFHGIKNVSTAWRCTWNGVPLFIHHRSTSQTWVELLNMPSINDSSLFMLYTWICARINARIIFFSKQALMLRQQFVESRQNRDLLRSSYICQATQSNITYMFRREATYRTTEGKEGRCEHELSLIPLNVQ